MQSGFPVEEFREIFLPGFVYDQETSAPTFCKPKLIPLKSMTLEKLEKMQSENMERLREMDQEKQRNDASTINNEDFAAERLTKAQADIWRSDE